MVNGAHRAYVAFVGIISRTEKKQGCLKGP